jgi:hypothetical protein
MLAAWATPGSKPSQPSAVRPVIETGGNPGEKVPKTSAISEGRV